MAACVSDFLPGVQRGRKVRKPKQQDSFLHTMNLSDGPQGFGSQGEHKGPVSRNLAAAGAAVSGRASQLLPSGLEAGGHASQELKSPLGCGARLDQRKVREHGVLKCFKVRQTEGWRELGIGDRSPIVQVCAHPGALHLFY